MGSTFEFKDLDSNYKRKERLAVFTSKLTKYAFLGNIG